MYNPGMTIAEVLGETITDRGITQEAAAAALGVKQPSVNRWLAGKATPGDELVPALVKFTGLKRAQVLEALHSQRTNGRALSTRVTDLEREVSAIRAALDEALGLLQELRATGH